MSKTCCVGGDTKEPKRGVETMMLRSTLLLLAFSSSCIGQELIEGRTFEHLPGVAIQLENRQNVTIRRCVFNDVGVAVRLNNCRNVTIDSCVMTDLTIQGIDVRDGCSDIRIVNNQMTGFRSDVQGGHFISTQKTDSTCPVEQGGRTLVRKRR